MPYVIIRASVTVPSEHGPEVHELLDQAIDQAAMDDIPVADSEVTEECADPPEESEEE
jgi:hypothetical protein